MTDNTNGSPDLNGVFASPIIPKLDEFEHRLSLELYRLLVAGRPDQNIINGLHSANLHRAAFDGKRLTDHRRVALEVVNRKWR